MPRFIRNAWYMVAWSEELTDQLMSRRIFDRQILLFRRRDGAAQAIADRCPHRFAPLSRGTRDGDAIVCPYHGLTFDGYGHCIRNPYSDSIPHGAQVDSWAVAERHDILWLWGGAADAADPSLIPDFSAVTESAEVHSVRGYTLLRAPYEYGIDNLMDLSHIEFVHRGTFAGNGVIFAGTHAVREQGGSIHSDWWIPDVAAPSHTRGIYPPDMRCDHWLEMRWDAPASMALQIGSTPKDRPRGEGVAVDQAHILTPATADTTHYFWATSRRHDLESVELDGILRSLFQQAFDEEDKPIIQAAFENLEGADFWDAKPISLGIDAGGIRVRRRLKALLSREADNPRG